MAEQKQNGRSAAKRIWKLGSQLDVDPMNGAVREVGVGPDELDAFLQDIGTVLRMNRGTVSIVAQGYEDPPGSGIWVTTQVVAAYHTFAPPLERPAPRYLQPETQERMDFGPQPQEPSYEELEEDGEALPLTEAELAEIARQEAGG
jgi:hypothetical protein